MTEKVIYFYHTSPNQKCVVTKKTQSDKEHTYALVNLEAMFAAACELSDRAFKLYSRLNMHCDGYTYGLSPVEIQRTVGMSEDRYRTAVKELVKKGYLVQSTSQRNLFTFYEYPRKDAPSTAMNEEDQLPKITAQSSDITQTIPEKPQHQPSQNQGRNITTITSHNTRDNTVNIRPNNTRLCDCRSSIDDLLDDTVSCITGTSSVNQRGRAFMRAGTNHADWSRMASTRNKSDIQIIETDEDDLPF